jgi:hypothetical protein
MAGVDCHSERDLMGDGRSWRHGYEAVGVRCTDCHGAATGSRKDARPGSARPSSDDAARVAKVLRTAWQRRGRAEIGGEPLLTASGTPLWRTDATRARQALAETGKVLEIPVTTAARHHTLRGHERLSCQACHSSWAPRCTSCHTSYRADGRQVDHLTGQETRGEWLERAGGNGMGPPLLAWGPRGEIAPFVEGMTLRIDGLARPVERILWAPLDPHTTGSARPCASCHPAGRVEDVAPEKGETTRIGAHLLAREERARIARVGACVSCHGSYEDPIYLDFTVSVDRVAALRRDKSAVGHGDAGAEPGESALRRCTGEAP